VLCVVVCSVLYACITLNFVPTWGYGFFFTGDWCIFHIKTSTTMRERHLNWWVWQKLTRKTVWGIFDHFLAPAKSIIWGLIWTVLNGQDQIFSGKRHRPKKSVVLFLPKWGYFANVPPAHAQWVVPSHVQQVCKFKEPFEPYVETCTSFYMSYRPQKLADCWPAGCDVEPSPY